MNKRVVANILSLALIAGVAATYNVAFVKADDVSETTSASVSGNDASGNDVESAVLGDVNLDGEITYLDAMTVLRYEAELITLTDTQLALSDVNADGSVDYLDAITILRYEAELIDSFATTSGNDVEN